MGPLPPQVLRKRPAALSAPPVISIHPFESHKMSIGLIVLIVVILLLVGAFPTWSHSRSWGYGPSGGLGLVLIVIVILFALGRI
jgi:hypothetical protein